MLISQTKKFIFIHVWKTGGTSIKEALKKYASTIYDINGSEINMNSIKHFKAVDIKQKWGNLYDPYFKFLFVRNPWDIQVSYYNYILQNNKHNDHLLIKSFTDFKSYIRWRVSGEVIEQWEFGYNGKKQKIIDYIGKYENIDRDFAEILSILKINNIPLQKLNHSQRSHYHEYYDEESKNLISMAYCNDIEIFHYSY